MQRGSGAIQGAAFAMAIATAVVTLAAPDAAAHPAPPPDPPQIATDAAPITIVEWSTWLRGGLVVASSDPAPAARAANTTTPDDYRVNGAIGAGFTLPVGQRVRVGPWVERRTGDGTFVGGEVDVLGKPGGLDLFWYAGQRALVLRAGANSDLVTAQIGVAYRAPWDLFGAQPRGSRYMIGASLVLTGTQSRLDPHDFTATIGLEFEPVGALRYLLGVRSWY